MISDFLTANRPRRRRGSTRVLLGLMVVLSLAAGAAAWWWQKSAESARIASGQTDDDEPEIAVVNPGYVGIETCVECHADRVKEFKTTRHFVACVPSSGVGSPGFGPGRGRHETGLPGLHFEMDRKGADFLLTGVQRHAAGESRAAYQVGLVYGASGKSDEMYFCWRDGKLFVHAMAWLYPLNRWAHGAETIEARPAESRCIECHNTWVAHVPGTRNEYRPADMLTGVTCERCHGPAREHVAHHRAHRDDGAQAIVHPGMLSRERLIEVCTQCHSPSYKRRGPAFSYRPGKPLEESFRLAENQYVEEDLVGNQIQYMRASKCFEKSEMTCITCHDPHRPTDHHASSRSCTQCHAPASCKDQPNLPTSVRGDCAGCHMPPRVWMGAMFHTSDDRYYPVTARSEHRIAVYPDAKKAIVLKWLRQQPDAASQKEAERLADELSQYWTGIAEQRRRQHRLLGDMQAMREAVKVDPRPATRRRLDEAIARQAEFDRLNQEAKIAAGRDSGEAMDLLRRILKLKPDDAKTHGKLGALLASLGRRDEAKPHLDAVAKFDPHDAFGLTTLASLAHLEGRPKDAAAYCVQADAIEPYTANTHYLWGTALFQLERYADAAEHLEMTLTIDPRHALGHQAYGELLLRQGQATKALTHAKRAVRLTQGKNIETRMTLAEVCRAVGQPAEARAALEAALAEASATHSPLLPLLRARLRELP